VSGQNIYTDLCYQLINQKNARPTMSQIHVATIHITNDKCYE